MVRPTSVSDHPDVMISSTYTDLTEHRKAAIDALLRLGFFPIGMEFDSAKSGRDVIDSSLSMVEKAHAYVGIVSHRYGGVPKDVDRNPNELSITEIEYRAALERGIPVYMFIMSDTHPTTVLDIEPDDACRQKLKALKADARGRSIAPEFASIDSLKGLILQSMAELKLEWKTRKAPTRRGRRAATTTSNLASPPDLLAIPGFVAGHEFVGRREELLWLDQWAASDDPIMAIEAIGGAGKSTLTWHWVKTRAHTALPNLAGKIWYSFYEGGADMAEFAAYALAYTTGRSVKNFRGRKTSDLARALVGVLQEKQFLLVLDGFERVLIEYHHFDASQRRDDAETGRDGRACTKPADADFLRSLITSKPSKVLLTSRLLPSALTNPAGFLLPGVGHRYLGGMDPDDAMLMMQKMGVRGSNMRIRHYLDDFGNHPLIVGIVGGLVVNYTRDPGNFDRWAEDPQGGASLHLSRLDLKQRRTHILASSLNGLEPGVRQLLSYIAALGYAAPFETVAALNPFGPEAAANALVDLVEALQELERRGLLHWDRQKNTYDMHPVVRAYAFETLEQAERTAISNRIVDHFESKPPDAYANVKSLADVQQSLTIYRALVHAGRFEEAARFIRDDFVTALLTALEEYLETLALLAPLFPDGFASPSRIFNRQNQMYLLDCVSCAYAELGLPTEAEMAQTESVKLAIAEQNLFNLSSALSNLSRIYIDRNQLAGAKAFAELKMQVAPILHDAERIATAHSLLMSVYTAVGAFDRAEAEYEAFRKLPMPTSRNLYRPGSIETKLCQLRLQQGTLTDELLEQSETVARQGENRFALRWLCDHRAELALLRGDPQKAIVEFEREIEMLRTSGSSTALAEAKLALALAQAGDRQRTEDICACLTILPKPPHVYLAAAYLELGDEGQARKHALAGYPAAWADGPQYSNWRELRLCRSILQTLNVPEPVLPAYDPAKAPPLPFEKEIRALIARG